MNQTKNLVMTRTEPQNKGDPPDKSSPQLPDSATEHSFNQAANWIHHSVKDTTKQLATSNTYVDNSKQP